MVALLLAVGASTLIYGIASGATKEIWILPDELTYGLLARSFASTGRFAIRGVDTLAYPVGYPALISPAFLGRGPVAAYDAARWVNALLMSLAAIPTYLLARRLLTSRAALLAAGLTLVVPSMAYTRVLMTENAFFPLTLLTFLAIVRALERPSTLRQLAVLAVILLAVSVRSEGLVLLPVFLLAAGLLAAAEASCRPAGSYGRAIRRELREFRFIGILVPLAAGALFLAEAASGRSPTAILGRYGGAVRGYPIASTLRWFVYQLVDLELYVCVIPLVPAVLVAGTLLKRGSGASRGARAVAATAIPATVCFVLAAAATSQQKQEAGKFDYAPLPPELHDRYCFYAVPLILILFLFWVAHRDAIPGRLLIPLLLGASALPLALPYADVHTNADFDALALLPWSNGLIGGKNVHFAMAVVALVLCASLVPRRRSIVLLQIALPAMGLLLMNVLAGREMASASTVIPTSRLSQPDWVDRAVPPGAQVAVVWRPEPRWPLATLLTNEQVLWRTEFLNPSITRYFFLGSAMFYDLPEDRAAFRDGRLSSSSSTAGATARSFRFVLTNTHVAVPGVAIGRDRAAGLILYRLGRSRSSR